MVWLYIYFSWASQFFALRRVEEFTILHPNPDSQGINMNHVLSVGLLLSTAGPEQSLNSQSRLNVDIR